MLPETLSRADVVFNLGRMGLLLAGLADPTESMPEATDDRIHQLPRTTLFPEAPGLLQRWSTPVRWRRAGRVRAPALSAWCERALGTP